jgi:hypothetical protein
MQFINILLLASAAMSADAAPAGELHARASNVKLAKVGNKWQAGWTGATTSQRYTCSNNGLLVSPLLDVFWWELCSLTVMLAEHPELQLCFRTQWQ